MSIQTTQTITRREAIDRISEIINMALALDYRGITKSSFEPDLDACDYTYQISSIKFDNIESWTNRMLEYTMDKQFIRYSMFDNYKVVDS